MYFVIKYVKPAMDKHHKTVSLAQKDIIWMVIMTASNVIKHVKLVMEELPQTARLVH